MTSFNSVGGVAAAPRNDAHPEGTHMRKMMIALSALALGAAMPAIAQDAMASHDQMSSHDSMSAGKKMSAGDMKKMKACSAMSHDAAMKNAGCTKLMKDHPGMMKQDAMMSTGH
jgi:hypothetical protein